MKYVLALDQGTTSSRAALIDENQRVAAILSREFPQIYPAEGWVEHDPMDIWSSQYGVMMEVVAKSGVSPEDIAAIGITNQRETTVVWEKATGKPVYNAIVWQCRRTASIIAEVKEKGFEKSIRDKTGLIPDAYFSASKIKWILDREEGLRARAERGELLFGTVDTWLVWKLTGGKVHVTDRTNASRTMLFNIQTLEWDEELLRLFGVPRAMLPEVRSSGEIYGMANVGGMAVPIAGIAGDQQAALFGQGCWEKGEAKNTYGTGCFLLMNAGCERPVSKNGLLATVAATAKGERVSYALEGSVFIGGAVIQWLRDALFHGEPRRGILRAEGDGHGRRVYRARVYGDRSALLGHVRPRRDFRAYAGHQTRTYHQGRPGIDRLSVGRSRRGHGKGHGRCAEGPESGRRGFPRRLSHAVSGGYLK